jgi:SAM-dependent methyltransferase
MKSKDAQQKQAWDEYWLHQNEESMFGRICALHRKLFISRLVQVYTERYFPKKGIFLEAGSGSSGSSFRINKYQRKLIALDISPEALKKAKAIGHLDEYKEGSIFDIPYKANSLDGIWNLGVMEHFTEEEITNILKEFYRVLKPGGTVILFWPPVFGSSQVVLTSIEKIYNAIAEKKIQFFPDEVSVLKGSRHARRLISHSKFQINHIGFSPIDLYTHLIVVLKKPEPTK